MRTWKAVALGALAATTVPAMAPIALALVRPFVKAVTKQALVGYELARVRLAFATEGLEDVIAEARAEAEDAIESRRRARTPDGAPPRAEAKPAVNGATTAERAS